MANTSLPCSAVSRAVINEPDWSAASTTSVPCASPAIKRLRLGKLDGSGGVPSRYSLTSRPRCAMRCASSRCLAGYTRSSPVPTTATVATVVTVANAPSAGMPSSAPSCAAPSTPSARPDTIVSPACASALEKCRALAAPCGVGLRLPTTARLRARLSGPKPGTPSVNSIKGGSSMFNSPAGYSGSPSVNKRRGAPSGPVSLSQRQVRSSCSASSGGGVSRPLTCLGLASCASADSACSKIAPGRPQAASSSRALSLPTPGVRARRSQADSSS